MIRLVSSLFRRGTGIPGKVEKPGFTVRSFGNRDLAFNRMPGAFSGFRVRSHQ
ncbi:MAG: hypothetical protein CM15mP60_2370 [Alphaproteobacteria bacterium]|nr:MAG: hypothetical protein CM15mP60_2370 [Alphaproteobacteria bacterium]